MDVKDLRVRTRNYSLRIIKLYDSLPTRGASRVIGEQVLRSGTSVGAHYREAIRGRSPKEYAAKLDAGLMELEETLYWLELLEGAGLITADRWSPWRRKQNASAHLLQVSGFMFQVFIHSH